MSVLGLMRLLISREYLQYVEILYYLFELFSQLFVSYGRTLLNQILVCLLALHMSASTCDSLLCASQGLYFHGSWNREVFLWEQRQRPAAVALHRDRLTPYSFGFVIGSPGPKDTVHHLTCLNACKMSNQRCVWSLRRPR